MDKNRDNSKLLHLLVGMIQRGFIISNLRIRRKEVEVVLTDSTKTFAWTLRHEGGDWQTEWGVHAARLLKLLPEPQNMIDTMYEAEQKMLVEFGTAAFELGGRLIVDDRQVYTDVDEINVGIKTRGNGAWQTLLATLPAPIAEYLRASLDFDVLFQTYANGKATEVEQILGANRLAKNAFMGVMKIAYRNLNAPTQVQLIEQAAEDWEYQQCASSRVGYSQGLNRNQWSDQKNNYISTVVDTQDKTKPVTYSVISVLPFSLSVVAPGREAEVMRGLERLVMAVLPRLPDEMTLDIREADPENKLPSYFVDYMTHGKAHGIESKLLAMLVSEISAAYMTGRSGDSDMVLRRVREAYDRILEGDVEAASEKTEEAPHPTITAGLVPSNRKVKSVAFIDIGEQTAENFKVQIVSTGAVSLNLGQDFLSLAEKMGNYLLHAADEETKKVVSMTEYRVSVVEAFRSFQQHGKTQEINLPTAASVLLELLACALGDYPIEELAARIRRSAIDRPLPVEPNGVTGREFVVGETSEEAPALAAETQAAEKKNRTSKLQENYILRGPPYQVTYVARLLNLSFKPEAPGTEDERTAQWKEKVRYVMDWLTTETAKEVLAVVMMSDGDFLDVMGQLFRSYYMAGDTDSLTPRKDAPNAQVRKLARLAQVIIDCHDIGASESYLRERVYDALRATGEYAANAAEEAMQDHLEKIDNAAGPVSQRDTDNIVRSAARVFGPQQ